MSTPPGRRTTRAPERIRRAAQRLFAERGPEDVTMAEVAAAAGVARATVFNHFGSKGALIESMTASVLDFYQGLLEGALEDRERSTPAILRHLFILMGDGIETERRLHRAVFREIAKLSLGMGEAGPSAVARRRNQAALVALISRGQARGDISKSHTPESLAIAFDSLVSGTITHWLYDDDTQPLRERMSDAADIFLAPVSVQPTAPDGPDIEVHRTED